MGCEEDYQFRLQLLGVLDLTWTNSWLLSEDIMESADQLLTGFYNLFIGRERHDCHRISGAFEV
jgi:hypothetical protein